MKTMLQKAAALLLLCMPPLVCAAPATVSAPGAPIPFKRAGGPSGVDMSAGAIGVLGMSLLAIGGVWLVRKRLHMLAPAPDQHRALRVVTSQRLGPMALLTVVEFDGRQLLLAHSKEGITCLASSGSSPAREQA